MEGEHAKIPRGTFTNYQYSPWGHYSWKELYTTLVCWKDKNVNFYTTLPGSCTIHMLMSQALIYIHKLSQFRANISICIHWPFLMHTEPKVQCQVKTTMSPTKPVPHLVIFLSMSQHLVNKFKALKLSLTSPFSHDSPYYLNKVLLTYWTKFFWSLPHLLHPHDHAEVQVFIISFPDY